MDREVVREVVREVSRDRGSRDRGRGSNIRGAEREPVLDERCYNCEGWGHRQAECPSPAYF